MSETTRTTNAMQISFRILGEIKVDDDIDSLNVDTTSEKVGADQVAANAIPEVMEDAVTVVLEHLRMGIKAGVS